MKTKPKKSKAIHRWPITSAQRKAFKAGNTISIQQPVSDEWNEAAFRHGSHVPISYGKEKHTGVVVGVGHIFSTGMSGWEFIAVVQILPPAAL